MNGPFGQRREGFFLRNTTVQPPLPRYSGGEGRGEGARVPGENGCSFPHSAHFTSIIGWQSSPPHPDPLPPEYRGERGNSLKSARKKSFTALPFGAENSLRATGFPGLTAWADRNGPSGRDKVKSDSDPLAKYLVERTTASSLSPSDRPHQYSASSSRRPIILELCLD